MRPVLILLTEGFADWETGLIAANLPQVDGLNVRNASLDGAAVTSLGGLYVSDLAPFDPSGDDVVVLCGGTIWESPDSDALIDRLTPMMRAARGAGASLAGICAGATALARMGVLDGIRHTGNGFDSMTQWAGADYPGHTLYCDQPHAVRDQGIVTASGVAPVSFAAAVMVEAGAGPEVGAMAKQYLGAEFQTTWDI